MAEAARIADSLLRPTWVLALKQTQGRARRGRAWTDPAGNFAGTLIMQPSETVEIVAQRSFVASLALFDAFALVTGRPQAFSLKWPNDVLLHGEKVAGILLEGNGGGRNPRHLFIGVGVNLLSAPGAEQVEQGAQAPTSLFSATGVRITPEEFLDVLGPAYARREAQFAVGGFEAIRDEWLSLAARRGEVVTARRMTDSVNGTFETVDATGAIVLQTAKGRVAVSAAEIFF
ncbi:biotin--[acetyl-CoA-carboxylase] ligase [Qingshengfaniella alkalisoli]|uniref:biotin--[biotin carboxyl-carrier protein] ligase n=2 Tax=Qingshengfaniella alkalisoli TaxID=2599296 RepID=A0A5B8IX80_9RHOB|nr:biotin--[acetyl-CoA-carboxylase] ligase [Qingshengfaniella alkalisoli]